MARKGLRAQTNWPASRVSSTWRSISSIQERSAARVRVAPKYAYCLRRRAPPARSSIGTDISGGPQRSGRGDISRNLNTLIVDLDRKVNEVPAAELAASAQAVLHDAKVTFGRIDRLLADGQSSGRSGISIRLGAHRLLASEGGEIDRLVKDIDKAAQRADALLADNQYDVRAIVQDLRTTSTNLRTLSDSVKRYPAGALLAGPPDKVQLPRTEK